MVLPPSTPPVCLDDSELNSLGAALNDIARTAPTTVATPTLDLSGGGPTPATARFPHPACRPVDRCSRQRRRSDLGCGHVAHLLCSRARSNARGVCNTRAASSLQPPDSASCPRLERINYNDVAKTGKVYVGYIGRHLPLAN